MTWSTAVLLTYTACLIVMTSYSLFQAHLLFLHYRAGRAARPRARRARPEPHDQPFVSVQVPLYNEPRVAAQVIDAVAALDWPSDRLEIQILDDSTDETTAIVAGRVEHWAHRGLRIHHVRRVGRTGYKAGALAEATDTAQGEFAAIFDADFVPASDFLRDVMPRFDDPRVGMVQARWGHLNRDESALTRVQALYLDAFFRIEQPGRQEGGYFLRFNGSAGVWRKACIADAGGWSADTLSEDLDLCYRAQLRGWRMRYAADVIADAEIPPTMAAFKMQQTRWTQGKAQVIRKLGRAIVRADAPLAVKAHAFADLFNIAVHPCALLCALLSIPVAAIVFGNTGSPGFLVNTSFALFPLLVWIWYVAEVLRRWGPTGALGRFLRDFPLAVAAFLGLTSSQSAATLRGLAGPRGEFRRTPKFGVTAGRSRAGRAANSRGRARQRESGAAVALPEAAFALLFAVALIRDAALGAYAFMPFHFLLTLGFAFVAVSTAMPIRWTGNGVTPDYARAPAGEYTG